MGLFSFLGSAEADAAVALTDLGKALNVAQALLPTVAAVNAVQGNSNNGVAQAQKIIAMVTPLVLAGNQQAKIFAAQNNNVQLTGPQKLQNALNAVEQGFNMLTASGVVTTPYAALLPLLEPAINAVVAGLNTPTTPALASMPAPAIDSSVQRGTQGMVMR